MSIYPAIFATVACFLAFRYVKGRRDRNLPITARHRIRVGLLIWAFGISALCVIPILTMAGPFPSPGGRPAAVVAFILIGWIPLVVGLFTTMAQRLLRRPGKPA